MSLYSGKCDVYDTFIAMANDEDDLLYRIQNTTFHIDNEEIEINSVKDLVPYFPCIESMSCWSGGKEGSGSSWFSSRSFTRQEDDDRMAWRLNEAKRVYRRLKRKKEDITTQKIYDGFYHYITRDQAADGYIDPIDWKISQRVAYDGEDAYVGTDILQSHLHIMERKELFNTMLEYGYTTDQAIAWVYEGVKTW